MSAVLSTTDMWRLHPGAFTLTLMRAAQGLGAELRLARLTGNIGRTAVMGPMVADPHWRDMTTLSAVFGHQPCDPAAAPRPSVTSFKQIVRRRSQSVVESQFEIKVLSQ
jgi:hypothetical protein